MWERERIWETVREGRNGEKNDRTHCFVPYVMFHSVPFLLKEELHSFPSVSFVKKRKTTLNGSNMVLNEFESVLRIWNGSQGVLNKYGRLVESFIPFCSCRKKNSVSDKERRPSIWSNTFGRVLRIRNWPQGVSNKYERIVESHQFLDRLLKKFKELWKVLTKLEQWVHPKKDPHFKQVWESLKWTLNGQS